MVVPDGKGFIFINSKEIPKYRGVSLVNGLYHLDFGMYIFNVNETINLPSDICAITIQRSSLMRSGVNTNIGFWDSGYLGKGYSTINIMNPNGFTIQKDASIVQMVFLKNVKNTVLYNGSYRNEGITV
jgi:dUTP pyrophosphatase